MNRSSCALILIGAPTPTRQACARLAQLGPAFLCQRRTPSLRSLAALLDEHTLVLARAGLDRGRWLRLRAILCDLAIPAFTVWCEGPSKNSAPVSPDSLGPAEAHWQLRPTGTRTAPTLEWPAFALALHTLHEIPVPDEVNVTIHLPGFTLAKLP